MPLNPDQDFVLKTIKGRDVHFVRFWFTDVLGTMKSFAVIPSELEDAFTDGMGFDGSCVEGFCRTQESDMLAFPDAGTFLSLIHISGLFPPGHRAGQQRRHAPGLQRRFRTRSVRSGHAAVVKGRRRARRYLKGREAGQALTSGVLWRRRAICADRPGWAGRTERRAGERGGAWRCV